MGKFSSGSTGDAINRLQELGVTTKTELTKMGLQFDKSGSLIIKDQADMDRATGILLTSIKGKYGGLMDAQSSSLSGMLSNFSDWKDGVMRQVTAPLFEPLKAGLKAFLDYTGSDAGKKAIEKLTAGVQVGVENLTILFSKVAKDVKIFYDVFAGHSVDVSNLSTFQIKIREVAAFISDNVLPTIQNLWIKFGDLLAPILSITSALSPLSWILTVIEGYMRGGLPGAVDAIKQKFSDLAGSLGTILALLVNEIVAHAPEVIAKLADLGGKIVTWLGQQVPILIAQLLTWGKALVEWIQPHIAPMLGELGKLIVLALGWLAEQVPKVIEQLARWEQN